METPDKLRRIFHALANARFPLRGDEQRDARIGWLRTFLGREISSSKELSAAEIKKVIAQLSKEVPREVAARYRPGRRQSSGNVVRMPNRGNVTDRQAQRIELLAKLLGWTEPRERLAGFLFRWYRVRDIRALSFQAAHRCIDSLVSVHARERVKSRLGKDHPVSLGELATESAKVREELQQMFAPSEEDA